MINHMLPLVDFTSGEMHYKPHTDYFGTDESSLVDQLTQAANTVTRMADYSDNVLSELNNYLADVIKDWAESKSAVVEMNERIHVRTNP
jgi:hypothetical protein